MSGPHERRMMSMRRGHAASCIGVLRDRGAATVTETARATGLSRPTVESIIVELTQAGLVGEQVASAVGRSVGRPARQYVFLADARYVASVDVGIHTMTAMVADLGGRVLVGEHRPVPEGIDASERIVAVRRFLHDLMARADLSEYKLHTIVAGVSGIVDPQGRVVLSNPVPEWSGVNLAARLGEGFLCPVVMENDVNMAALAEHQMGSAQLADDVVFVLLGHRMSAGLILGGKLYRGHNNSAGELADLSAITSPQDERGPVYIPEIFGEQGPEHLMRRAAQGDPEATALVRAFAQRLAVGIASLGSAVDPVMVVVGGGLSGAGETLLATLREAVGKLMPARVQPTLVASTLGSDGVAFGGVVRALQIVSERFYKEPELHVPRIWHDSGFLGTREAVSVEKSDIDDAAPAPTRRLGPEDAQARVAIVEALRIGVVGVGARSRIVRWVNERGMGARVVATADPHPAAVDRAREYFGERVRTYSSHRELESENLDAVFVLSPSNTHGEIAVDLLRARVPVYLEKPLAITTTDADEVLHTAMETGTRLYVGHNMRHMAAVKLMRGIISRGEVGQVRAIWCRHFIGNGGDFYFKDWHAERERSTGLVVETGAHDIDAMHWLAGSLTQDVVGMGDLAVYGDVRDRADHDGDILPQWFSSENWPPLRARGLNPVIDVEDLSMVLLRMKSGVLASYQQCNFTPDNWRNYTVIGTEGRLENFGDQDGGVVRVWNRRTAFDSQGDQEYSIEGDAYGHTDSDALTVAEFLRFVRTGEPTTGSPLSARHAVATAIAATESLRSGSSPRQVESIDPDLGTYFGRNQPLGGSDRPSRRLA